MTSATEGGCIKLSQNELSEFNADEESRITGYLYKEISQISEDCSDENIYCQLVEQARSCQRFLINFVPTCFNFNPYNIYHWLFLIQFVEEGMNIEKLSQVSKIFEVDYGEMIEYYEENSVQILFFISDYIGVCGLQKFSSRQFDRIIKVLDEVDIVGLISDEKGQLFISRLFMTIPCSDAQHVLSISFNTLEEANLMNFLTEIYQNGGKDMMKAIIPQIDIDDFNIIYTSIRDYGFEIEDLTLLRQFINSNLTLQQISIAVDDFNNYSLNVDSEMFLEMLRMAYTFALPQTSELFVQTGSLSTFLENYLPVLMGSNEIDHQAITLVLLCGHLYVLDRIEIYNQYIDEIKNVLIHCNIPTVASLMGLLNFDLTNFSDSINYSALYDEELLDSLRKSHFQISHLLLDSLILSE